MAPPRSTFSTLNLLAAASASGGSIMHGSVKFTILQPLEILEQRLVQRGNKEVAQAKVRWTFMFPLLSTWEDLDNLKLNYPDLVVPDTDGGASSSARTANSSSA